MSETNSTLQHFSIIWPRHHLILVMHVWPTPLQYSSAPDSPDLCILQRKAMCDSRGECHSSAGVEITLLTDKYSLPHQAPVIAPMIIYRMAKSKSVESPYCSISATSKASWGQWWKFELLTESLVWYPGKIIALHWSPNSLYNTRSHLSAGC